MRRRLRPRVRLRLMLLAVLSLVFQQVALASYMCSVVDMPAGNMAMSAHCRDMPMAQDATHSMPLCAQHCAQQSPTTQDARLPSVPFLPATALLPSPLAPAVLPASQATHGFDPVLRNSGIPPALRFRVLLI